MTKHNPRVCCGGYEAETPSAEIDSPHMQNHTIRECGPPGNGRYGCRHWKAVELLPADAKHQVPRCMEPVFGKLIWTASQQVGGRIKNPTNTIQFIHQHEVPKDQMKDITYGQFVCTV
jgi:hypothetical protein